ncbi:MAG TPA: hypothetical protein VFY29_01695 [Terriglobia bacterium]|nr:hypothetical protein [Terriglobia bacterium]
MKISINNSRDFLALLVRRKWWVVGPFLALTGMTCLLIFFLPKVFVSETLIMVRPPDVPGNMVPRLIPESTEQRIKAIEQTVLSRTVLVKILNDFGDRMPELDRFNLDERVLKLRDQIRITVDQQRQGNSNVDQTYFFRIAYQNREPELAQTITNTLTSLFIAQDNELGREKIRRTTQFLQSEVDKVSAQLDESENKLRQLKASRTYELPAQLEPNLRSLEILAQNRRTNAEALDRSATQRLTLQQQIAETPETIPKPITPRPTPPPAPAPAVVSAPQPLPAKAPQSVANSQIAVVVKSLVDDVIRMRFDEYRRAQAECEEAQINHTPNHPDVIRCKARVERAKAQLPPELLAAQTAALTPDPLTAAPVAPPVETPSVPAAATAPAPPPVVEPPIEMMPNPVYRSLVGQLQQVETELAIRAREKAQIEADIAKYSKRVESTPKTEQDLESVIRENNDIRKQYNDLSAKLADAKLAENLDIKQQGQQFVIVDPANYPLSPEKPQKPTLALGAGILSLFLSIGIAVGVDITRQRVWAPTEIEALWGVPVLVDIPEILMEADVTVTRKKRHVFAASAMAMIALYSICLYGIYLKHGFILRQLDPLLQKIVYR